MKKHVKIYMDYYGYCEQDVILCSVCGKQANSIHHIKYRSQGGKDEIGNLIATDQECHDKAHFKKKPYIQAEELFEIVERML